MHISLLAEIEDSVLPVSPDGHAKIVAAWAKICHMETISEAPLDLLYLCNAWSDDQEVIDVDGNVHTAPNKDTEISVDGLKAKIPKEVGESLIPDPRCLFQAIERLSKLADPRCAICSVVRLFDIDLMVYLAV